MLLEGQARPTWLSLSGDSAQPYASLLAETHRVLDHLASLTRAAAVELAKSAARGSIEQLYFSDLGDWDEHDDVLQLELSPVAEPILVTDVRFEWSCGGPKHLVVLRANDGPRIEQGQLVERGLA